MNKATLDYEIHIARLARAISEVAASMEDGAIRVSSILADIKRLSDEMASISSLGFNISYSESIRDEKEEEE